MPYSQKTSCAISSASWGKGSEVSVGIDANLEVMPRADYEQRSAANDFDVAAFLAADGFDSIQAPRHFVPAESFWSQ